MLQTGLLVVAAHGGLVGLLVHQITVHLHPKVCVIRFRPFELEFRVDRILLHYRVAQFHDDGTWLDNGGRSQNPFIHMCIRLRRDPPDVFRHQDPQPAHFPQHRAALHFIREDRGTVHTWRGRPQLRESIGYPSHEEERDGAVNDSSDLLGASIRWSLDIHILSPTRTQLFGPRFPSLSIFCFNDLA